MSDKSNSKKALLILFTFFVFAILGLFSNVKADCFNSNDPSFDTTACVYQRNAACQDATSSQYNSFACQSYRTSQTTECNNPFSSSYTTQACVEYRLGLSQLQTGTIVIARDPNSIIVVAFRIFLYIVITIVVGRIVWVGVQIVGVGDDADKRKELFVQLVYILGGLIVAIGALGITFVVQNIFFGKTFNDQIIKCSDLPTNASQELKDKCKANVGFTNTPAPTISTYPTVSDAPCVPGKPC